MATGTMIVVGILLWWWARGHEREMDEMRAKLYDRDDGGDWSDD
jgi:hypothetical protein